MIAPITRRRLGATTAGLVAAALAGAGALVGLSPAQASPTAPTTDTATEGAAVRVTGASLAWGFNNESSNSAFAPGTANFFSAGKVPNTGGGRVLTQAEWKASAANVIVQKRSAGGGYQRATWAGLKTQPDGTPLGSPTSGTFSHHRVLLKNGTGQTNPAANTATLRWNTDFTVVYYSGYTYFYVSDPVLVVKSDKTATLRAKLSGFGSSQSDPNAWEPLPVKQVVLANFTRATVTGSRVTGLTPKYRKVKYTPPAGSDGVPQVRNGSDWGAFPKSYVDYQQRTGQHSYWYSSGGSTDDFKVALPVTVTY